MIRRLCGLEEWMTVLGNVSPLGLTASACQASVVVSETQRCNVGEDVRYLRPKTWPLST